MLTPPVIISILTTLMQRENWSRFGAFRNQIRVDLKAHPESDG